MDVDSSDLGLESEEDAGDKLPDDGLFTCIRKFSLISEHSRST